MAGTITASAEVAGRFYQPGSKMMLPDAVDHHTSGQRVLRAGNGSGQLEPPAPVLERLPVWSRDDLQASPGDFVAFVGRVAAKKDASIPRSRPILERHRIGRRTWRLNDPSLDFRLELAQFNSRGLL